MIIKKYVVEDMREALIRAKYEMGKDAIILSQKEVRPGKWYQLFRRKKLEVTLAIEEEVQEKHHREKAVLQEAYQKKETLRTAGPREEKPLSGKKKLVFGSDERKLSRWQSYSQKKDWNEEGATYAQVKQFIEETYPDNAFLKEAKLQRINILVGPTGVGKTTTMAKIASQEYLLKGRQVGLITIDTYRIAAVEQLRKYAEILGITCVSLDDPSQMKESLEKLADCDLILMDTAGASPRNEDRIEDIRLYLDEMPKEKNVYLTLSMSTDVETNQAILKAYKILGYSALILTKFDEVAHYGNFWNLLENNVLPVQYYCYGQNVPEEMEEATLDRVLNYLWRELQNG